MTSINLTELEARALKAWEDTCEDFDVISFDTVARYSGIERSKVRAVVRRLARKGITVFYRTSWTEDGEVHGAGYGLTKDGRAILNAKLKEADREWHRKMELATQESR